MTLPYRIACAAILTLACRAQDPVRPVDPVVAITGAFRSHQLVALGDNHGNQIAHSASDAPLPLFVAARGETTRITGSVPYCNLKFLAEGLQRRFNLVEARMMPYVKQAIDVGLGYA